MQHESPADQPKLSLLYVIPCLNEEQHIAALLEWLIRVQRRLGGQVVVADGGSTDRSRKIVGALAQKHANVHLIDNPAKIQSAAINSAVTAFGETATHLIRIDAHAAYPEHFCETLLSEAHSSDAASVVVSMKAAGDGSVQRAIAAAQNAPVGNGGAKHRIKAVGEYVDHGHHALIRLDAFRSVGGYDASFSHNEDAEFDHRLRKANHRIWLTGRTEVIYFPRKTIRALARQYFNFGAGRSMNLLKHRVLPNLRQLKAISILPLAALAYLSPISPYFALPGIAWVCYCFTMALERFWLSRDVTLLMVAPIAMVMHIAWSCGFWCHALRPSRHLSQRAA